MVPAMLDAPPSSAPSEPLAGLVGPDVVDRIAAVAGAAPHTMTSVKLLRDGAQAFPAMLEAIAAARRQVLFENFIFAGDATGQRFAEGLSAAARRGVEVRVLYDPVGTALVRGGSIARVLRRDGVTVRPFRPLSPLAPWSWLRLRHRDHRKTLTVDGELAVVGGLCISNNWSASESGGCGWRDTALLVGGPVAGDVERAFESLWRRAGEPAPSRAAAAASRVTRAPAVLVAADEPGSHRVSDLYAWLAAQARHSLEITDAYLVTPRRVLEAFEAAARRGVEVRMLLPGRNNHPAAGAAARRSYSRLLAAGVGIWEWKGVMVHAKTAVVDGVVSLVGSSNLDPLSMRRNYELNLLVIDPETGAGMRAMFATDLTGASRIDPVQWGRRPRWHRAIETGACVFAPNL
jgi:cardiolipin synthase